jgi:hypothetical protein
MAWGKAIARVGPPDTTFFISVPVPPTTLLGCANGRSVARFGHIDRRFREVTSRLDALCTLVTIDS